jgi:hypothetical protein
MGMMSRSVGSDGTERIRRVLVYIISYALARAKELAYVAETALPSLNGHDGLLGLDDAQVERVLETEPKVIS